MLSILVVDDATTLASVLAAVLRSQGHEVSCADSAEAALMALEHHPVDLLLADARFPYGITGYHLAEIARCRFPALKCILMTGEFISPADVCRSPWPILLKPFPISILLKMVQTMLVGDREYS